MVSLALMSGEDKLLIQKCAAIDETNWMRFNRLVVTLRTPPCQMAAASRRLGHAPDGETSVPSTVEGSGVSGPNVARGHVQTGGTLVAGKLAALIWCGCNGRPCSTGKMGGHRTWVFLSCR